MTALRRLRGTDLRTSGGAQGHADAVFLTEDEALGEALVIACEREGLSLSVRSSTSKAHGPSEAQEVCEVVVLDLLDGGTAPAEGLAALGDQVARVTALGDHDREVFPAIHVDAWVEPTASVEEFVAVVSGGKGASRNRRSRNASASGVLTPRELDVLAELLAGGDNGSMAGHLGISELTVRTHIHNILRKLGVSSRAEAASWALHAGLAPAPRPAQDAIGAGRE